MSGIFKLFLTLLLTLPSLLICRLSFRFVLIWVPQGNRQMTTTRKSLLLKFPKRRGHLHHENHVEKHKGHPGEKGGERAGQKAWLQLGGGLSEGIVDQSRQAPNTGWGHLQRALECRGISDCLVPGPVMTQLETTFLLQRRRQTERWFCLWTLG